MYSKSKTKDSLYEIVKKKLLETKYPDSDLLKYFNKKLSPEDRNKITKNVDLRVIWENKDFTWSLSVIKKRDDLRFSDIKELSYLGDFSSCYYKLTMIEIAEFCDLNKLLKDYPFHEKALQKINVLKTCESCLIKFMQKYPNLRFPNWKRKDITRKISLDDILKNLDIQYWDSDIVTKRVIYDTNCDRQIIMKILYKNPYVLNLDRIISLIDYNDIFKFLYLDWNINLKITNTSKLPEIRHLRYFYENNIPYCENSILEYKDIDSLYLLSDKLPLKSIRDKLEFGSKGRLTRLNRYELPQVKFLDDMTEETRLSSWKDIDDYPFYNWETKIIEQKSLDTQNPIMVNLLKYFNKRIKFDFNKLSSFYDFNNILDTPYFDWNYDIIGERKNIPFEFFKIFISRNISTQNISFDYEVEKELIEIAEYLKEVILVSDLIIDIIEYL